MMGLKVSRCLPSLVLFVLFATQLPVNAQSVPCAAITRNPLVLEALLDSHSKEAESNLQDDTINAAQLARLHFSPIIIQPGDALYVEYRGRDFVINADFASGERTEFDSSPKGSNDQWRKGILPLDMFHAALSQRLIRLRATAKNPNQVAFRNIKIVRAGRPVFEFAKLSTYARTQLRTVAPKELPCKGVDEYPNTATALSQANLLVSTGNVPKTPLTFTVQEIYSMMLDDAPVIHPGDFMAFESNRGDFSFYILLSNGKEIVSRPLTKEDAEDTAVAWRKVSMRLDYPEALNQRIVRQAVVPLHQGGTPLLLRGMKIDGSSRLVFELEKSQPGIAKPKSVEPPMSYPPDARVMTASATTGNIWGHSPDAGFLAPKLPTFFMHPMMFQSSTNTSDPNHFKFNGKELDAETGLYNYGARYYSPGIGRFVTPDPTFLSVQRMFDPQQWNMYSYARNNPLKYTDPDGKELVLATGMSKADTQRVTKALVEVYRKPGGATRIENLAKSNIKYAVGTGDLQGEGYGLTKATGKIDPATGKVDRSNTSVSITLDFAQRDKDSADRDLGLRKDAPPTDEQNTGHEIVHADIFNSNPDGQLGKSPEQKERDAAPGTAELNSEKKGDKKPAENRVNEILNPDKKKPEN